MFIYDISIFFINNILKFFMSYKIIRFRKKGIKHNVLYDIVVMQCYRRIDLNLLIKLDFLIQNASNILLLFF